MNMFKLSGAQIGALVNSGQMTAEQVIQEFKKRVNWLNPLLNAFTYTKFGEALEEAREIDKRVASGEYCGPFAGVPVALKDFLPSKTGWQNSHGGVEALVATDDSDSEFYKAAKKLGAIAIGKTNAPAFGFSGACQNKMYGATANPYDLTRTSGGSSGGSGSAVGAGLVALAEGGDAGGSIRIPAGWCNCFGFKPSIGTVPSYCRPDGWTATHPYCFNGAITRSVLDSAILLNEMAKYNPRDPISLPINSEKNFIELMGKSVKGMKLAFTYDFDIYTVDDEIKDIVYKTAKRFEEAGATVDIVQFNFKHILDEILHCWAWAISVDTAIDLEGWKQDGLDLVKDHRDQIPEEFIKFNDIASKATIFDMRKFNEIRTDILDNFEDVLEKYDAIISPTAACEPMKLEDEGRCKVIAGQDVNPDYSFISFGLTPMVNFVGYPAASVPAGFTESKLPVGMQIIGKQYHDEDVFRLSYTIEKLQRWYYNNIY